MHVVPSKVGRSFSGPNICPFNKKKTKNNSDVVGITETYVKP